MKHLTNKKNCQFRSCQFKARLKFGQKLGINVYLTVCLLSNSVTLLVGFELKL
jgi:hypothetical protein